MPCGPSRPRLVSAVLAAAAVELSVTPGAVAQHVKALEAWIGADLFERRSQGVALTAVGAAVADDLGSAFDRLGEAVIKMRRLAPGPEIRIATLPSVAQLWLSPRLPRIRQAVPEATVSVIATERPPNTLREPIDLTLFFEEEIRSAELRRRGPRYDLPRSALRRSPRASMP